ncbi:MAG TPA: hypothetical protein VI911_08180 [Patescibacteria group bacterium]|nr:hypothetical protein [Patescibacteria group bacterium]
MNLVNTLFKKINKICLNIRYKVILLLIHDMPVIVNCVVDNTTLEKNILDNIECICYNNKVIKPEYHYDTQVRQDNFSSGRIKRQGNSFCLTLT